MSSLHISAHPISSLLMCSSVLICAHFPISSYVTLLIIYVTMLICWTLSNIKEEKIISKRSLSYHMSSQEVTPQNKLGYSLILLMVIYRRERILSFTSRCLFIFHYLLFTLFTNIHPIPMIRCQLFPLNLKGCWWVQGSFWIFRTFLFHAHWWRCL